MASSTIHQAPGLGLEAGFDVIKDLFFEKILGKLLINIPEVSYFKVSGRMEGYVTPFSDPRSVVVLSGVHRPELKMYRSYLAIGLERRTV